MVDAADYEVSVRSNAYKNTVKYSAFAYAAPEPEPAADTKKPAETTSALLGYTYGGAAALASGLALI